MREVVSVLLAVFVGTQAWAAGQPGLDEPGLQALGNGQWRVTVEQLVPAGNYALTEDPGCSEEPNAHIQATLGALTAASNLDPKLKLLAGPIIGAAGQQLNQWVAKQGGDIGGLLAPNRIASCAVLAVKIPQGSNVNSTKYTAGDGDRGICDCPKDGRGGPVCRCGWCRWDPAQVTPDGVAALFTNWKDDRARWASLTVVFTPPPGVTPQTF